MKKKEYECYYCPFTEPNCNSCIKGPKKEEPKKNMQDMQEELIEKNIRLLDRLEAEYISGKRFDKWFGVIAVIAIIAAIVFFIFIF